jgi:3D (Asp-Asp-Asp) domain-containing protein
MTIIHGFTSFNTIAPASRIAPSSTVTPGADKGVRAAAADWSRWPAGTVFRLLSTEQNYRVEDYGGALSGRNTIDLYMANQREMNSSCAREETSKSCNGRSAGELTIPAAAPGLQAH